MEACRNKYLIYNGGVFMKDRKILISSIVNIIIVIVIILRLVELSSRSLAYIRKPPPLA